MLMTYIVLSGKLETMSTDLPVLMHKMGFTDLDSALKMVNERRRPFEKANATSNFNEEYWTAVDEQTLKDIREMYSLDIQLFNYSNSPFT